VNEESVVQTNDWNRPWADTRKPLQTVSTRTWQARSLACSTNPDGPISSIHDTRRYRRSASAKENARSDTESPRAFCVRLSKSERRLLEPSRFLHGLRAESSPQTVRALLARQGRRRPDRPVRCIRVFVARFDRVSDEANRSVTH